MKIVVFDSQNSLEKIIFPNFNIELLTKNELPIGNKTKLNQAINISQGQTSIYLESYLSEENTQLELPDKQNSSYQAMEYFNEQKLGELFQIPIFIGNLHLYAYNQKITRPLIAYQKKREHEIENLENSTQKIQQWSQKFQKQQKDKFAQLNY